MAELYLSPEDLARMFTVPVATVYAWNHRGTGPRRIRVVRHIRYRASDVSQWVEKQSDPLSRSPHPSPVMAKGGPPAAPAPPPRPRRSPA